MEKYLISEIKDYLQTKKVRKSIGKGRNFEDAFAKIDDIIEKFYTGGSEDFDFIEKVTNEVYNFSSEKKMKVASFFWYLSLFQY
ncbi:hypothetical protein [Pediococcus acidilactici]|uniref:hypothetical protein n=1 Tax=Pediococcus acidilactici TaxID=1254 RepID=UPI001898F788|nr:hypothetical protein [Pediococcus acidilactici]